MTAAAQDKIEEIDTIWRELETEALDQVEPLQLRTQLSAIARNLSRHEEKVQSAA